MEWCERYGTAIVIAFVIAFIMRGHNCETDDYGDADPVYGGGSSTYCESYDPLSTTASKGLCILFIMYLGRYVMPLKVSSNN